MFRSRVKLFDKRRPTRAASLVLSTLTKAGHPVSIADYTPNEQIVIEVPCIVIEGGRRGHAEVADNGQDTIISVANEPVARLKGFIDLEELDVRFVSRTIKDDIVLFEGLITEIEEQVQVIDDADELVVVSDFDLRTDKLEIGPGHSYRLEKSADRAGTIVLVDDDPVFLLHGVMPADMASAMVQAHASR